MTDDDTGYQNLNIPCVIYCSYRNIQYTGIRTEHPANDLVSSNVPNTLVAKT